MFTALLSARQNLFLPEGKSGICLQVSVRVRSKFFVTNIDLFHSCLDFSWAGYEEMTEIESSVVNWDSFHLVGVEEVSRVLSSSVDPCLTTSCSVTKFMTILNEWYSQPLLITYIGCSTLQL